MELEHTPPTHTRMHAHTHTHTQMRSQLWPSQHTGTCNTQLPKKMHLKVYEANIPCLWGGHLTNGNEDEVDLQVKPKVKGKVHSIGQSGTVDPVLHNVREGLPSGTNWGGGRRGMKERRMRGKEGGREGERVRRVKREEGREGGWGCEKGV